MTDARETFLWDEVKALLRAAAEIFGEPTKLLEEVVLPRSEALLLRAWLCALETLVRALLLRAAARMPPPADAAPARPRRARSAPAAPCPDDPAPPAEAPSSEHWAGVAFNALPPSQTGGRGRGRGPGRDAALRFIFTRSFAYRLEALIRVAEAPEPYARRLARRLHGEPALAERALSRPRGAPYRPLWENLIEDAVSGARTAARAAFCDTG